LGDAITLDVCPISRLGNRRSRSKSRPQLGYRLRACPRRRDWPCNAPAESCRATNCSCASLDRKASDDSLNNWTQIVGERICLRRNLRRPQISSTTCGTRSRCQAGSSSAAANSAQNVSLRTDTSKWGNGDNQIICQRIIDVLSETCGLPRLGSYVASIMARHGQCKGRTMAKRNQHRFRVWA
jgi:hypothetical protein